MTLAPSSQRPGFRPQLTTLVLLSVILFSGAIATAWFAGNGTTFSGFNYRACSALLALRPRVLVERKVKVRPVAVRKV